MAFRGLFIGIDRYASPGVNWLSCASRDAKALHALFTDTLGGETTLLTDEQATVSAIRGRFEQLATCNADDVVTIAFSGHGTETHELVAHDTDPRDLPGTTIPLTTLGEWCSRIPSRRLLIVLDCCFSGGMGAKALEVEGVPRDFQSVDGKLNQIGGAGRVVLTASGPTQRAGESARLGAGFLTLHLLEALQGPEEIREGDQVAVLRVLDYVVKRVVDAARQIRREQQPAVRGTFDGEFRWPVLSPGAVYRAAFPDFGKPIATAEINSLAAFGFPQAVLDAWAVDIPRLNHLQLDAINEFGILRGEHVVASAPTSSGKTMLGDLAAVRGALDRRRTLFLLPLKALVNERPVPLDEGVLCSNGTFRYFDGDNGQERMADRFIQPLLGDGKHRDWVIPLVGRLVQEGKQVIVFRETTGQTRYGAEYLADALGLPQAAEALADLPAGDPSQASGHLRQVLARGVAFHNSHLDREERRVIEEHFLRRGTRLRVIVATTTLAMGVNTPASAVVIVGLEHPGPAAYSVAEYKNLVGRAGRLGYAERGASYLIATSPHEEHQYWQRFVSAAPENLVSRFLSADPRTLIIRVLVAAGRVGEGVSGDEIIEFLESSFGVFQMKQAGAGGWDRNGLARALGDLERHGLIERGVDGRFHLTALGRLAGESAVEVETLIRAIPSLRALRPEEVTDPALIAIAQASVELDAIYFPFNKKSTQKEPQHWVRELQAQGVAHTILAALRRNVTEQMQDTARAKKAVVCLYYLSGMSMGEIERAMGQFGGAFDGAAGPIRSVTGRTCDVLPMIARAAQIIHQGLDLQERTARLLLRLDLGIQGPAVGLARHACRSLDRSDYWRLCEAPMTDPEVLAATNEAALPRLQCTEPRKLSLP